MSPEKMRSLGGVGDGSVFYAGSDVDIVDERGACAVFGVEREVVASVELVNGAGLDSGVVEAVDLAFAERVERSAAVAHVAFTLVLCVGDFHAVVHIPAGSCDHVLCPCGGLEGIEVVVVAEAVALANAAVGVSRSFWRLSGAMEMSRSENGSTSSQKSAPSRSRTVL